MVRLCSYLIDMYCTGLVSPHRLSAAQQSIIQRSARVVCRVYAFGFYGAKGFRYIYWGIYARSHSCHHSFPAFLGSSQRNGMVLIISKRCHTGQKKLHIVLTYLSNMGLILLGAAILGAISRKWDIALEVI
jgi:hypothetical protein